MSIAAAHNPRALQSPTAPVERGMFLDVLRGFALLEVVLASSLSATGFNPYDNPELIAAPIDSATFWVMQRLIGGRFYTLFAFLFGVGFALQFARAQQRGEAPVPTYLRRIARSSQSASCTMSCLPAGCSRITRYSQSS